MGWCHEFGPQIKDGCSHPMVAGAASCTCPECGVVCTGRFNGCSAVWTRGPVTVTRRAVEEPVVLAEASGTDVHHDELPAPDFTLFTRPVPVAAEPPPITLTPDPPPVRLAPRPRPAPVVRTRVVSVAPRPRAILPAAERPERAAGLPGVRQRLDDLRAELRVFSAGIRSGDSG